MILTLSLGAKDLHHFELLVLLFLLLSIEFCHQPGREAECFSADALFALLKLGDEVRGNSRETVSVCQVSGGSSFASSLGGQDLAAMVRALVDRRPLGFVRVFLTPRRIEVDRHGSTCLRSRRGGAQHQTAISYEFIYSFHLFDATVDAPFLSVKLFHVDSR